MRNARLFFLFLFVSVCWFGAVCIAEAAPTPSPVNLVSPSPGEWVPAGGSHQISWNYIGRYPLAKCSLFYKTELPSGWVFLGATAGTIRSWTWNLPRNLACDSAVIRIKTVDSLGAFGLGFGSCFKIIDTIAPVVTVAPFSAKKVAPGSDLEIKWTAADEIGIKSYWLFASNKKKSDWTLVSSLPPTVSTFAWRVPEEPCTTNYFLVVATDKAGNSGTGFSDAFRVTKGSSMVLLDSIVVPSGGYLNYSLAFDGKPSDLFIKVKPSWNIALVGNLLIGGPVMKPGVDTVQVVYKLKGKEETFSLRVVVPAPVTHVARKASAVELAPRIVSTSNRVAFSFPGGQSSSSAVSIYDCAGRKLWSFRNAGDAASSIACPMELKNGVYWASITSRAQTSRHVFRVVQ